MRKKLALIGVMLLLGFVASGSDCIFDTKVVELIVTGETCPPKFMHYSESATYADTVSYRVADDLDDILADNDLERTEIDTARLISVSYEVLRIAETSHDWTISGQITIEYTARGLGPEVIVDYDSLSLESVLGSPEYASLNAAGVAVFHAAVDDYLDGGDPEVTFRVESDSVSPIPNESDPIDFWWKACLRMYIILDEEFEWPDPWPGSDEE
jgi:hypothetical protein